MAGKRKFKVRVRGKVRNQLLRRGGTAAGLALGLLLASWFFGAALKASRGFIAGRVFSFRPASFSVDCPSAEASVSARELMAATLKAPLSARRCAEIAEELRRQHPGLSDVSVARNFFTGRASVKAVPEDIVSAVMLEGATAYLSATGRLLGENITGKTSCELPAEIGWPAVSAPGLAAFLKDLNPLLPVFSSRPSRLECPGSDWACTLRLADGTSVLWGEFEFTRLKVIRLNEVMKDASLKRPGPLLVDMRYFREGKIFVSAAK
jgi:hypothetical protein